MTAPIHEFVVKQLKQMEAKRFLCRENEVVITGNYAFPNVGSNIRYDNNNVHLAFKQSLDIEVRTLDRDTPTKFWVRYADMKEIRNVDD